MNKTLIKLGNKIDNASDLKNIQALKACIDLSQKMEVTENFSNDEKVRADLVDSGNLTSKRLFDNKHHPNFGTNGYFYSEQQLLKPSPFKRLYE